MRFAQIFADLVFVEAIRCQQELGNVARCVEIQILVEKILQADFRALQCVMAMRSKTTCACRRVCYSPYAWVEYVYNIYVYKFSTICCNI